MNCIISSDFYTRRSDTSTTYSRQRIHTFIEQREMWVACDTQQPVGTIYASTDRTLMYMDEYHADRYVGGLYLDIAYRQQGLGRQLLQTVTDNTSERYVVGIAQFNIAAIRLFQGEKFMLQSVRQGTTMPNIQWGAYTRQTR